jgi:hypothetical protein
VNLFEGRRAGASGLPPSSLRRNGEGALPVGGVTPRLYRQEDAALWVCVSSYLGARLYGAGVSAAEAYAEWADRARVATERDAAMASALRGEGVCGVVQARRP